MIRLLGIPVVQTMHDMRAVCPISSALRNKKHCTSCAKVPVRIVRYNCRDNFVSSVYNLMEWYLDRSLKRNYVKTIIVSKWQYEILDRRGYTPSYQLNNFVGTNLSSERYERKEN